MIEIPLKTLPISQFNPRIFGYLKCQPRRTSCVRTFTFSMATSTSKKDASNSATKRKTSAKKSRKLIEEEGKTQAEESQDNSVDSPEATKKKTSVEIGTAFELHALKLLRENFSMALERVAGPGDGGVDLVGWWWLPQLPGLPPAINSTGEYSDPSTSTTGRSRIRVWAQCKAEKTKMGPNYVREMEGVLYRLLLQSNNGAQMDLTQGDELKRETLQERDGGTSSIIPHNTPSLAMLISLSSFTNGAVMRAMSSPMPFILLHLPPQPDALSGKETTDSKRQHRPSLQWNAALGSEKGILGGNLEVRWERGPDYERPRLWWKGQPLPDHVPS
jgi:hypothetical protein